MVTSSVLTEFWATELWVSTTNNRASATLATTERGSSYTYATSPSTTRYFWIRAKGLSNQTNGAWYPSGATSGISGSSNAAASIPATTSVSAAGLSTGSSISNPTVSAWETWYSPANGTFTCPSSGNGYINGYLFGSFTTGAITGAGVYDQTSVLVRTRLYDSTAGADVPNQVNYVDLMEGIGNIVLYTGTCGTINFHYSYGQLGQCILGHNYTVYLEVMKTRNGGTTATTTVTINSSGGSIVGNAVS